MLWKRLRKAIIHDLVSTACSNIHWQEIVLRIDDQCVICKFSEPVLTRHETLVTSACMPFIRTGTVSQDMLDATDKKLFVGIGGLEAASQLLGFIGASKLPGAGRPAQ